MRGVDKLLQTAPHLVSYWLCQPHAALQQSAVATGTCTPGNSKRWCFKWSLKRRKGAQSPYTQQVLGTWLRQDHSPDLHFPNPHLRLQLFISLTLGRYSYRCVLRRP